MSGAGATWVSALAPAKVNLTLEVLGRRADGYHELRTLMLALDLCDVVAVRAAGTEGVRMRLEGRALEPDVPRDRRNLAWRAAELLLEWARGAGGAGAAAPAGLELVLDKRIPSGAGLGGASSDAAAVALAAARALGLELAPERLRAGLAHLGSDCVFFADAAETGVALCTGRGERVQPLAACPDWTFVLVTPAARAPTGRVYGALASSLWDGGKPPSLRADPLTRAASAARPFLSNDLEGAALRAIPELGALRELLTRHGAEHFRLCGSGSSFFGVHEREEEARAALAEIERAARAQGIALRSLVIARASGHGARLCAGS